MAAVRQFVDRPSVVLISQLRCNNSGNVLTLGNIHVSWENLSKPDLQCIEVINILVLFLLSIKYATLSAPMHLFLLYNSLPVSREICTH